VGWWTCRASSMPGSSTALGPIGCHHRRSCRAAAAWIPMGKPPTTSRAVALRSLTPQWSTSALGESAGCLGRLSGILPVSVREIPFPTIAYLDDPFATFVSAVFGLFFVLVFIWPLTRIIKSLVEEYKEYVVAGFDVHRRTNCKDKEARINEVMKMMGMPAEAITFGWYLTYGILWLIPAALMTIICWGTVFQHSNKFVVFLFFWLFGMCARIFFLLYFPYMPLGLRMEPSKE
ncbi:ABCA1, partial [Symbiodinium sp. KB8]